MEIELPEFWIGRIIKNAALGAALIGQTAYSYYEKNGYEQGIDFMRSILILPMLFHSPTVTTISSMNFESGLRKAVLEKKIILNGLEDRIKDLLPTTFRSIQMGSDSGLYRVDKFCNNFQIIPKHGKFPKLTKIQTQKIKDMFAASKRLGFWLSEDITLLYKMLQVRV
jgi:hypothetical protein